MARVRRFKIEDALQAAQDGAENKVFFQLLDHFMTDVRMQFTKVKANFPEWQDVIVDEDALRTKLKQIVDNNTTFNQSQLENIAIIAAALWNIYEEEDLPDF